MAEWYDLSAVHAGVIHGDSDALEKLYIVVNRATRPHIARQHCTEDSDDLVHEIYQSMLILIQNGEVKNPYALASYARVIAHRMTIAVIRRNVFVRCRFVNLEDAAETLEDCGKVNPEESISRRQETMAAVQIALQALLPLNREILTRFYLQEQSPKQIQKELGLSLNQFRVRKSRALALFGKAARTLLQKPQSMVACA